MKMEMITIIAEVTWPSAFLGVGLIFGMALIIRNI